MNKQKEIFYESQPEIFGDPEYKVDDTDYLLAASDIISKHTGINKDKIQYFIDNFGLDMILEKPSVIGVTKHQEAKLLEIGKILRMLRGQDNE